MNSTKTPPQRVFVLPAEARSMASARDKRLIACEKSQPGDRRVTIYVLDRHDHHLDENGALGAREVEIGETAQITQPLAESEVVDVVVDVTQWTPVIGQLLAGLRDRGNRPIAVYLEAIKDAKARMIALGFRGAGLPEPVFNYDIRNYKHTPDWLNSRHWANPELWDKYRW